MPPMFDMCLFSILAVLGAGIIAFDVWNSNNLEYYKKNIYLILFIIFLCITSLANIQYGFFQNLKFIVWTAISFFILYPHGRFETTETRIKKYDFISKYFNYILGNNGYSFSYILYFKGKYC